MSKKALIIGSGGREAMYAWRFHEDRSEATLICAPGNGGMLEVAQCYTNVTATDLTGIADIAIHERPEFAIVGPEAPLIAGIADRFAEARIPLLGPSALAARTEGSKVWFKNFLKSHGFPTADYWVFRHDEGVHMMNYVIAQGGAKNIVLKADGQCGGKGVILPESRDELESGFTRLRQEYGDSAEYIIVENREKGEEYSAIAITDSKTLFPFVFTRDSKRRYNGNKGPNTGGMGAYTIRPSSLLETQAISLLRDVVDALTKEGCPFKGIVYLGLMLTDEGFKILECNCRGGDPEMQAILASIDGNFYDLCHAAAVGDLGSMPPPRMKYEALCVVLTSPEYPEKSVRNNPILKIEEARHEGAIIIHAGTAWHDGKYWTNKSGRTLNVIGRALLSHENPFAEAHRIAYAAANVLRSEDLDFCTDIGRSRLYS